MFFKFFGVFLNFVPPSESIRFETDSQLTEIDQSCFQSSTLVSIELPPLLSTLDISVFSNCYKLESVYFTDSRLTLIPSKTFCNCTSLATITFSESNRIVTIDTEAFSGCSSLDVFDFSRMKQLINIQSKSFSGCKLTHLILPGRINNIDSSAFTSMNTVTITFKQEEETEESLQLQMEKEISEYVDDVRRKTSYNRYIANYVGYEGENVDESKRKMINSIADNVATKKVSEIRMKYR